MPAIFAPVCGFFGGFAPAPAGDDGAAEFLAPAAGFFEAHNAFRRIGRRHSVISSSCIGRTRTPASRSSPSEMSSIV